jgi:hypothetical protein
MVVAQAEFAVDQLVPIAICAAMNLSLVVVLEE